MQGRSRGNVAAELLCGALFVGLTTLKGYFYINLGGTHIGKIGAELHKERSEVFIQAVEIVEVHVGAGVIDPWDRTVAKGLAHRPGHTRLFLSHTNEDHSFLMLLF